MHIQLLFVQIVEWYVHKDSFNKTVRSLVLSPQMPPAVTSLYSPWSYSLGMGLANSSDLGTENSQQGKTGLKGAA